MGMDVASFAKMLREDGIDAAKTEAEKILAEARKEAEKIVSTARAEAEKSEKEANSRIQQSKLRAEEEMKLVARDLVKAFKKKIEDIGAHLLQEKVASTLNEGEVVTSAINELVKTSQSRDWEISLGAKTAAPLADAVVKLFRASGASAKIGPALSKAGFELKNNSTNEVFELTEESVTETFKNLLSPELKKHLEA